jgi:hypothetical protein
MKVNTDKVDGDIGEGIRGIDTTVNFYKDDVGTNGQGGDDVRIWKHALTDEQVRGMIE